MQGGEFGEQQRDGRANCGKRWVFGSEVAVVVALAWLSSVVASLSVAVPPVLPALSPALVVVAPVAVGSPGWCGGGGSGGDSRGERQTETEAGASNSLKTKSGAR